MRIIVMVFDKRCIKGFNTREKNVENVEDGLKWARSVKNKATNTATIINNSECSLIRL